jgi:hypothetical protein
LPEWISAKLRVGVRASNGKTQRDRDAYSAGTARKLPLNSDAVASSNLLAGHRRAASFQRLHKKALSPQR